MAVTVAADCKAEQPAAEAEAEARVPLPQLLDVASYRPNTLPYVPRAELERRCERGLGHCGCVG